VGEEGFNKALCIIQEGTVHSFGILGCHGKKGLGFLYRRGASCILTVKDLARHIFIIQDQRHDNDMNEKVGDAVQDCCQEDNAKMNQIEPPPMKQPQILREKHFFQMRDELN